MPDENPTHGDATRHVLYLLCGMSADQQVWSMDDLGREIESADAADIAVNELVRRRPGLLRRGWLRGRVACRDGRRGDDRLRDVVAIERHVAGRAWRYHPRMADFSQLAHRVVQATIDATEPGESETAGPQMPAPVNGRKGARPTPVEPQSGTADKAPGPGSKRRGPRRDG